MKRLLYVSIIIFFLTGCASVMEHISSVLSPAEGEDSFASQISNDVKNYYISLIGDKEVNSTISFQDFVLALQQRAEAEGLRVRRGGIDNIEFNDFAIYALEKNMYEIKENLREYGFVKEDSYWQKLNSLYEIMSKVKYDLCFFSLKKTNSKTNSYFYENGAYCYGGHRPNYEELNALFVNADRYFILKWGIDPDSSGVFLSPEKEKALKHESIFDKTYLLFAR